MNTGIWKKGFGCSPTVIIGSWHHWWRAAQKDTMHTGRAMLWWHPPWRLSRPFPFSSSSAASTHADRRRMQSLDLQNKAIWVNMRSDEGLWMLFVCVLSERVPSCAPHETFKVTQPGLNIAVWTGPRSQMPYRDSWLNAPSWAVWLCDVCSLFNIKEPELKIQQRKSVSA